jgi:hypothetical protein
MRWRREVGRPAGAEVAPTGSLLSFTPTANV